MQCPRSGGRHLPRPRASRDLHLPLLHHAEPHESRQGVLLHVGRQHVITLRGAYSGWRGQRTAFRPKLKDSATPRRD